MAEKTQRKNMRFCGTRPIAAQGQKQAIPENIDKLEKMHSATIASLQPYVLAHLAEVAEDFAGLQVDIVVSTVHPGQLPQVDERRAELEKLGAEKLAYMKQIMMDLYRSNNVCVYK